MKCNFKKTIGILLSVIMMMTMISNLSVASTDNPFQDVQESDWFYNSVMYVSENGLMKGTSEITFSPEVSISRSMIVTILYRLADSPEVTAENPFRDVEAGQWYTDSIRWAVETGVVTGYNETTFGPEDIITREQLAVILFRYAGQQGMDVSRRADLDAFPDVNSVSSWAMDAVRWAVAGELINGVGEGVISPAGTATRAQAAVMLMRFAQKDATGNSLALISTVDHYNIDYATKEWIRDFSRTYTYNEDGWPVRIDICYLQNGDNNSTTMEYTFSEGLPMTRKDYSKDGELLQTVEYNKGRVYEINSGSKESGSATRILYQYPDADRYFSTLLTATVFFQPDGSPGDNMEEVDSVQVRTRNGLLEQTVNSGLYANWGDGEEKEWMRFNGTYTANYDPEGILRGTSAVYRAAPPGSVELFTLTKENGRIMEAVRSEQYEGQKAEPEERYVFTYTDKEIDPARYAMMINEQIAPSDNNYYRYLWY